MAAPLDVPFNRGEYVVSTIHRAENTDDPERLAAIVEGLAAAGTPVLLLAHPRLVAKCAEHGIKLERPDGSLHVREPLAYPEMVAAVLGSAGWSPTPAASRRSLPPRPCLHHAAHRDRMGRDPRGRLERPPTSDVSKLPSLAAAGLCSMTAPCPTETRPGRQSRRRRPSGSNYVTKAAEEQSQPPASGSPSPMAPAVTSDDAAVRTDGGPPPARRSRAFPGESGAPYGSRASGCREWSRSPGLRWWAAFFVFAHHMTNLAPLPIYKFLKYGTSGVTFFFVLSGFVLTWSAQPGTKIRTFYRRQFARIFPLYFLTLIAAIFVFYRFDPPTGMPWIKPVSVTVLVLSGFPAAGLVEQPDHPVRRPPVGWTLSVEAFFYAYFPVSLAGHAEAEGGRPDPMSRCWSSAGPIDWPCSTTGDMHRYCRSRSCTR